jgi:chemotaxis protein CheD
MDEIKKYFLQPGYIFTSEEEHLVHTVLGSCISVCIYDTVLKVGGMNHYMYDKPFKNERNARYGTIAIPYLIKLIKEMGSKSHNMRAHVVGGAQNPEMGSISIGKNNIEIAKRLLKIEGIKTITEDIGGEMGRKVIFNNTSGEILVYKVKKIRKEDWYES